MSALSPRGKIGLAMVLAPPIIGIGAMLLHLISQAPAAFLTLLAVFAWFCAGMFLWITGIEQ